MLSRQEENRKQNRDHTEFNKKNMSNALYLIFEQQPNIP